MGKEGGKQGERRIKKKCREMEKENKKMVANRENGMVEK